MGGLTYSRAVILGVIQGLTEFLPVSSSGHLVLARALLGLELPGLHLEILLHIGTALAVALVLRRDIVLLVRAVFGVRRFDEHWALAWRLAAASIPAAVVGLFLGDQIQARLASPQIAALLLFITAVVLLVSRGLGEGDTHAFSMSWGAALFIGLAQAFAILPGLSRSGVTVVAALLVGLRRDDAARFSLLLSLPVIAGGAIADLAGLGLGGASGGSGLGGIVGLATGPLLAGVAVSLVFGIFAVRLLLRAVQRNRLGYFALYCAILGAVSLILLARG